MLADDTESFENIIKRNGFLFIDVPRTGSTSLKEELAAIYGHAYGKSDRTFGNAPALSWPDHTSAAKAIQILGKETWDQLFTFSVVRNPWDRAYSLFQYRRRYAMDIPLEKPFSEFIRELAEQRRLPMGERTWYWGYTMSSCDFLVDANGQMAVKFVGKYEARDEAIATINRHIKTPVKGGLFRMATTAGTASFQSFYTAEGRDLIAETYADDIERFGYNFDESPNASPAPKATLEMPHDDWLAHARNLSAENQLLKQQLADAVRRNEELSKPIWTRWRMALGKKRRALWH